MSKAIKLPSTPSDQFDHYPLPIIIAAWMMIDIGILIFVEFLATLGVIYTEFEEAPGLGFFVILFVGLSIELGIPAVAMILMGRAVLRGQPRTLKLQYGFLLIYGTGLAFFRFRTGMYFLPFAKQPYLVTMVNIELIAILGMIISAVLMSFYEQRYIYITGQRRWHGKKTHTLGVNEVPMATSVDDENQFRF